MHAGTCLHEILEEIDFANLGDADALVQRRLRAYGIDGFDDVGDPECPRTRGVAAFGRSEVVSPDGYA